MTAATLAVCMPTSLVGDLAAVADGTVHGERATARCTVAARTEAAADSTAAAAGNMAAQEVEHEGAAGKAEAEETAVLVRARPEIDPGTP